MVDWKLQSAIRNTALPCHLVQAQKTNEKTEIKSVVEFQCSHCSWAQVTKAVSKGFHTKIRILNLWMKLCGQGGWIR